MPYPYQVNYSKRFQKGSFLEGRLYHAHQGFCDAASAEAFASREGEILQTCDGTGGRYRLEDMQVICLSDFD